MKTITEFSGFALKDAMAKKAALLAEGKSEDEAQAAINEQLKLDETKLPFYKNSADMTGSRIERVKRVVVATKSSDTEKVPEAFVEREGHFYLVEFFPDSQSRGAPRGNSDDRDFRGGRGKGDRGRGNNRGDRGRGNDRGPRNDRGNDRSNDRNREALNSLEGKKPGGDRLPRDNNRGPRPPRAPRPEGAAPRAPREPRPMQGPKGAGELRLVLKGQSQTTLKGPQA